MPDEWIANRPDRFVRLCVRRPQVLAGALAMSAMATIDRQAIAFDGTNSPNSSR
jgi:hypothetical protein